MVADKRKAGSLRSRPNQHAIFKAEVHGRIELFARHDDADNRLASAILYLHIFLLERYLYAFVLYLIVDDGGFVDVAAANGIGRGLDDKEVLQRLGAVNGEGEVREVVAELHRLVVYAIDPPAKHRHLGSWTGTKRVASIAEMFEGYGLLGSGSIDILSYTSRKQQLAAMVVVHQELDGAQGTIVLPDDISAGSPCPRVVIDCIAVLIGTIDEAFVLPSVAPRVGNNPGANLILFCLTHDAVAIEVELNAVVVATDCEGMIEGIAPLLHIFHADNPSSFVGSGTGNGSPCAVGSNADACHTAAMHGLVAAVVVEPLFKLLPAFGGVGRSKVEVIGRAIPHGTVPFVVALHPTIVGVVMCLSPKESAIGASAVSRHVGDAYCLGHALSGAGLVSHQPREVRGILVLWQRRICIAIAVYLVRELITHTGSRAAGTAILIEDGREVLVLSIINKRRQLRLDFAGFMASNIIGRLGFGCHIVLEVGKDAAVYLHHLSVGQRVILYLRHALQGWHKTCYQKQTLKAFHVRTIWLVLYIYIIM